MDSKQNERAKGEIVKRSNFMKFHCKRKEKLSLPRIPSPSLTKLDKIPVLYIFIALCIFPCKLNTLVFSFHIFLHDYLIIG